MNTTKTTTTVIKNNKLKNKKSRKIRKLRRVVRRLRRVRRRRRIGNRLPAAFTKTVPKTFNTMQLNGTTATVSGTDLIYKIPTTAITTNNTQVITMIPANPAYWTGTRIAAIAQGYQNYRPLLFQVHYVPQCAVTQQGNVLAGTLWNEVPTSDNLQQTLKTSNGGILTQCYKPATARIRMKSNLQYNLYRMGGPIDQESNPFIFIALQIGCLNSNNQPIVPGYFYITYKYVLKNPIGTGITYRNRGIALITSEDTYFANAVAYLLNSATINSLKMEVGMRLDIEKGESNYKIMYNDTFLQDAADSTQYYWILENEPTAINSNTRSAFKNQIPYNGVNTTLSGNITIYKDRPIAYQTGNYYHILYNTIDESAYVNIGQDTIYYTLVSPPADYGPMTSNTASVLLFEPPITSYILVPADNKTHYKIPQEPQPEVQRPQKLEQEYEGGEEEDELEDPKDYPSDNSQLQPDQDQL